MFYPKIANDHETIFGLGCVEIGDVSVLVSSYFYDLSSIENRDANLGWLVVSDLT